GKDLLAVEEATLDAIDNAPIGPGSVAEEKGAKPGDDRFRIVNGWSPRITQAAGEKIGLGTRKYKLNEYEPVLSPENAAKWQIRKGGVGNHRPTTVRLRDVFYKHDLATEVMPFRRIEYDKEWVWNEWKKYDPFKGELLD
ncbi:MAG: hypothetical protein AB1Z20_17825, partial [Desulfobacterales bacterium]